MLPNSTIELINGQIETELEHLNSIFCDTQQDKMDTLERINKLQSMLSSPTSADTQETEETTIHEIDLNPLFTTIKNRLKKL